MSDSIGYHSMSRVRQDDILNINVGGKRFTVRRRNFLADPHSRLAEWFRPNAKRSVPTDKGGNIFLDRDPQTFRHILAYLRLKRDGLTPALALPSKPDDLSKLVGECEALNLNELREMALNMLSKYLRTDEQHFVTSYVQATMRDFETWQFEKDQKDNKSSKNSTNRSTIISAFENGVAEDCVTGAYDEW